MKILIADDEKTITTIVQKILQNAGHQVITTNDGTQVSSLIQVEKPHLLILDMLMPGMDGIENIIATHKTFPQLPIIAISSETRYLKAAIGLGAISSITKPIMAGKLVDMVSQFSHQSA